ncbi:MAG: SAM-dependent methyltransferase [Candidatus Nanopelagicaceae bacterium]|nr:SAM-dependent methyltransferase [Candidatus Nanopelagicaceae bacterium]
MTSQLREAISEAAALIGKPESLVRAVLSGSRRSMTPPALRIDIRPVQLRGKLFLQVASNDGRQTETKNHEVGKFDIEELLSSGFSNILVEQTSGMMSLRISKKERPLIHRESVQKKQVLDHDRSKSRLLDPSDPFLKEVGISDKNGVIKPTRQDKYRQVEEFLRLLAPTLKNALEAGQVATPTKASPLIIVDLGCGNAYLTFAVHQYLKSIGIEVQVIGIDIRPESRKRNEEIASRLGIDSSIHFQAEEISQAKVERADVVIGLHACDTATDDAIAWAVEHDAKLLFIAPCCHHDLQAQIVEVPNPWQVIMKHGLLKERFADLMTDALRSHILKLVGYRAEVIEFVGGEHTPRNLLIRAVKTGAVPDSNDLARYRELVELWKLKPALATRLLDEK